MSRFHGAIDNTSTTSVPAGTQELDAFDEGKPDEVPERHHSMIGAPGLLTLETTGSDRYNREHWIFQIMLLLLLMIIAHADEVAHADSPAEAAGISNLYVPVTMNSSDQIYTLYCSEGQTSHDQKAITALEMDFQVAMGQIAALSGPGRAR